MTTSARDAFDTVGDDDQLTDEQLDEILTRFDGAHFIFATTDEIAALSDDELLARLGLGDADDDLAFEARWGDAE